MSVVPVIASAEDLPSAIVYAQRKPTARWYVAKRCIALAHADLIPHGWGEGIDTLRADASFDPSKKARKKAASKGHAIPNEDSGGSFPIRNREELKKAIQAYGRSKPADRAKVRAHIIKRARAIKAPYLIPKDWIKKTPAATASARRLPRSQSVRYTGRMDKMTAAAGWDPNLHPRDRGGQFIKVGDILNIFTGAGFDTPSYQGKVVGSRLVQPGDKSRGDRMSGIHLDIEVTNPGTSGLEKGTIVDATPNYVTVAPKAKARLDAGPAKKATKETSQLEANDIVETPDGAKEVRFIEDDEEGGFNVHFDDGTQADNANTQDQWKILPAGTDTSSEEDSDTEAAAMAIVDELDNMGADYDEESIDDTINTVLDESPDLDAAEQAQMVAERLDLDVHGKWDSDKDPAEQVADAFTPADHDKAVEIAREILKGEPDLSLSDATDRVDEELQGESDTTISIADEFEPSDGDLEGPPESDVQEISDEEARSILADHLADTTSEDEEIPDPDEYAAEAAGHLEADDNSEVAQAIRQLADKPAPAYEVEPPTQDFAGMPAGTRMTRIDGPTPGRPNGETSQYVKQDDGYWFDETAGYKVPNANVEAADRVGTKFEVDSKGGAASRLADEAHKAGLPGVTEAASQAYLDALGPDSNPDLTDTDVVDELSDQLLAQTIVTESADWTPADYIKFYDENMVAQFPEAKAMVDNDLDVRFETNLKTARSDQVRDELANATSTDRLKEGDVIETPEGDRTITHILPDGNGEFTLALDGGIAIPHVRAAEPWTVKPKTESVPSLADLTDKQQKALLKSHLKPDDWSSASDSWNDEKRDKAFPGLSHEQVDQLQRDFKAERLARFTANSKGEDPARAAARDTAVAKDAAQGTGSTEARQAAQEKMRQSAVRRNLSATDYQARLDAILNSDDPVQAHKDLAKIMTEMKLGGRQRKQFRELLDSHFETESDGGKSSAADTAANLRADNPVKERLAKKAGDGVPQSIIDRYTPGAKGATDTERRVNYMPNETVTELRSAARDSIDPAVRVAAIAELDRRGVAVPKAWRDKNVAAPGYQPAPAAVALPTPEASQKPDWVREGSEAEWKAKVYNSPSEVRPGTKVVGLGNYTGDTVTLESGVVTGIDGINVTVQYPNGSSETREYYHLAPDDKTASPAQKPDATQVRVDKIRDGLGLSAPTATPAKTLKPRVKKTDSPLGDDVMLGDIKIGIVRRNTGRPMSEGSSGGNVSYGKDPRPWKAAGPTGTPTHSFKTRQEAIGWLEVKSSEFNARPLEPNPKAKDVSAAPTTMREFQDAESRRRRGLEQAMAQGDAAGITEARAKLAQARDATDAALKAQASPKDSPEAARRELAATFKKGESVLMHGDPSDQRTVVGPSRGGNVTVMEMEHGTTVDVDPKDLSRPQPKSMEQAMFEDGPGRTRAERLAKEAAKVRSDNEVSAILHLESEYRRARVASNKARGPSAAQSAMKTMTKRAEELRDKHGIDVSKIGTGGASSNKIKDGSYDVTKDSPETAAPDPYAGLTNADLWNMARAALRDGDRATYDKINREMDRRRSSGKA